MQRFTCASVLSVVAILILSYVHTANAATKLIASKFDDGTVQGWTRKIDGGNGTIDNPGTGGNPGGFLRFTDGPVGAPPENVIAPSAYLGDWSQALAAPDATFISLDAILIDPHVNQNNFDQIIITITGPGGSARVDLGVPSQVGVWEHFSVFLKETDWTLTSGTWAGLLANVTIFEIQMDWVNPNPKRTGIDNVILTIPEPATGGLLLLTGLPLFFRGRKNSHH